MLHGSPRTLGGRRQPLCTGGPISRSDSGTSQVNRNAAAISSVASAEPGAALPTGPTASRRPAPRERVRGGHERGIREQVEAGQAHPRFAPVLLQPPCRLGRLAPSAERPHWSAPPLLF
jgi:hypothetical protein